MTYKLIQYIEDNNLEKVIAHIKLMNEKNHRLWKVEMFLIRAIEERDKKLKSAGIKDER